MGGSNLGTPSKRIILLHAVHDCPDGKNAAMMRHMSFAQIICCKLSLTLHVKLRAHIQ